MAETTNAGTNNMLAYIDFVEYDIAVVIWVYVSPFLILTGTAGSIMSVFVLARNKLQSVTTMFYLFLLAVTDIFVLNTGLVNSWIIHAFDYKIRDTSSFVCQFHTLVVYQSVAYSSWVVVMLTIDRCISVCLPYKALKWCSIRNARVLSAVIFLLILFFHMHFFWTLSLKKQDKIIIGCFFHPDFDLFEHDVWPWIHFCLVCLIPFAIMIVCNILIVRQLRKLSQKLWANKIGTTTNSSRATESSVSKRLPLESGQQLGHLNLSANSGSTDIMAKTNPRESKTLESGKEIEIESDKNTETEYKETIETESEENIMLESKKTLEIKSERNTRSSNKVKPLARATKRTHTKLTVMLLSVNCVFFLLVSPVSVFTVIFNRTTYQQPPHTLATVQLLWAVVNMLMYANNSIHFFVIYLTVPSFRKWFLSMCRCKRQINN